ncbi:sigma-70 family RNA polymerase sigma factor [Nocardioides sp. InS609-2]|uniref:RNA polymerase sigma factor n=1 Tax=Nocardioides sp. InS609-2 TaxID=2760705 RepID=UPI0020BF2D84|nr:sigma-70 family RNA polymerase sigma factor [Nocardioides sp. InS609-2]
MTADALPAGDLDDAAELLDALWREHHVGIRAMVTRMCSDHHLVEDMVSETFLRALAAQRLASVNGKGPHPNAAAWLRAIARNLVIDHYRKDATRQRIAPVTTDLYPELLAAEDAGMLAVDARDEARQALHSLTGDQREALVWVTVHGYSCTEVGERLGRTSQAVRSLRHKALRNVRTTIDRGDAA